MKKKFLLTALFISSFSIAAPLQENDKLLAKFCFGKGTSSQMDMEIYETEEGDKYSTDVDSIRITQYGSAHTVDQIIEDEHGEEGECSK
ncbi:MAG: hypothetical protein KDC52_15695 [Ignavibacteriae bacterium]|nr:hypothetical protein [Ignavibacteriota bacterium]